MTKRSQSEQVATSDILEMFPDISRDVLYFLEKKGVTKPKKTALRKGAKKRSRSYSESDISRLFIAAQAYRMGLNPERVVEAAFRPELLRNEKQIGMARGAFELVKQLLLGDRSEVWKTVARFVGEQLESEACIIYMSTRPTEEMNLMAIYSVKPAVEGISLGIAHRRPNADWINRVEATRRPISLFGKSILDEPFASESPKHLNSGQYFSLLAAPVRQRKQPYRIRGWVVVENRIDANGRSGPGCYFDPSLEDVAEVIANAVSLVADFLPYLDARHHLMSAMKRQPSLESFLRDVLDIAVLLTGAHRGDVAWLDRVSGRAAVIAQCGESQLGPGVVIANRSVSRRVFETGQLRLIANVRADPDYAVCDDAMNSELCAPVIPPGERESIGVINVESAELNGFDQHDCTIVQELADYPALYGHMLETYDMISSLMPEAVEQTWRPLKQGPNVALKTILKHIADDLGLDRGIIYLADYRKAQLRCAALYGFDESAKHYYDFHYPFTESALATKVFHDRQSYFVSDPPDELSVSKRGLEFFDIRPGPLVGAPLLFGPTVIGVMVVWSSNAQLPTKNHQELLIPYASLAVTTLAVSDAQQKRKQTLQVLASVREVLAHLPIEAPEATLHRILLCLIQSDFERARVFRFDRERYVFSCVDSVSVDDQELSYKGTEIDIDSSPYAEMTLNIRPEQWRAIIRDPRTTMQVDPNAEALGKPPHLPWAVGPLFVSGVLYGYLASDNRYSERPIADANLESVNVFGALAAQALLQRSKKEE